MENNPMQEVFDELEKYVIEINKKLEGKCSKVDKARLEGEKEGITVAIKTLIKAFELEID